MINFLISSFIILSISSITQAMDNKKIVIEKQPFGISINNIANVRAIVFLGNNEIVAYRPEEGPVIIDFSHNKVSHALTSYIKDPRWRLCSDQSKTRAMFSSKDDSKIVIYNFFSKMVQSLDLRYRDSYPEKEWKACFDENKPHSIFHETSLIHSYDYNENTFNPAEFIRSAFSDRRLLNYQYIFNPLSKTAAIISGYPGGFQIDYDLEDYRYRFIEIELESPSSYTNYICNLDTSFIAHYSDAARSVVADMGASADEGNCRGPLTFMSGCCITNIKTGDSSYLQYAPNNRVAPCSMQFHPNNKVLVTMSAGDRNIEYWQALTGQLLAKQELPDNNYEGKFLDEVGTFKQWLDFSANGELLAAVFPNKDQSLDENKIVIFNVPFEAQCGLQKNTLVWMLWCLKNYQHNGKILPKDIVRLLLYSFRC